MARAGAVLVTLPGAALLCAIVALPVAPAGAGAAGPALVGVTQPPPPVTGADFPEERSGALPADDDGLIPNPQTPTGQPVSAPSTCSVTFDTAAGATSGTVNAWIAANENSISSPTVVCLTGTFTSPLHVWGKTSTALLVLAPAPATAATLDLGQVTAADTDPNQFWADAGGVSIVDTRSVEVYGLTIEDFTTGSVKSTPAGIYVTARSDTKNTDLQKTPHLSACYLDGGSCSDIYLLDNTVEDITNTLDQTYDVKAACGNPDVDAYGIAVIGAGSNPAESLQHVVIEGNTVTGTRTGQSETITVNGEVTDFLVAENTVHDDDNIGMDTIGWETGSNQANHGLMYENTVYDIDTYSNAAYGKWDGTRCTPGQENAAGIYDDGGAYVWIDSNVVWNTDQGINLDVETPGEHTDHLLVSGNDVEDSPGTATGDPSAGPEPPGVGGSSTVAGHDPYAFYLDSFGKGATISAVYVHDNFFRNQSQFALQPKDGMPVADFGGHWSDVQFWHNTVEGMGPTDLYNPLMEVDNQPSSARTVVVNCNDYGDLTTSARSVNGNFALPDNDWLTLAQWQKHNGHGWDADSAVGSFDPSCPSQSIT